MPLRELQDFAMRLKWAPGGPEAEQTTAALGRRAHFPARVSENASEQVCETVG